MEKIIREYKAEKGTVIRETEENGIKTREEIPAWMIEALSREEQKLLEEVSMNLQETKFPKVCKMGKENAVKWAIAMNRKMGREITLQNIKSSLINLEMDL